MLIKKAAMTLIAITCGLYHATASAQVSGDVVKIGVMTDMSGLFSDLAGAGSVEAASLAIEEFGGKVLGKKVELVWADHQNKPDIGSGIARAWFDKEGVDAIADFSNSGVAFAVLPLANERKRIMLMTAASSDFTGKACTPFSTQWVYNSYSNGYGLARFMTQRGMDSVYLLAVDYAWGHAFANDVRKAVTENGGKVVGEVRFPLSSSDFSSYLLQAQASKAKLIVTISAGSDMTSTVKQAKEFGITPKQALAATTVYLTDLYSLGLEAAQGMQSIVAFYWDRTEASRAWSDKFFARRKAMPTMNQAGVYSAVLHYLKAVEAAKTDDAAAVAATMRELPVKDMNIENGRVREDGQVVHDMYLVEVKRPSESTRSWDFFNVLATVPAEQAFQPLSTSACPLVKK